MSQIQVSKFQPRPITVYPEFWDTKKAQLIPITSMEDVQVCDVLDSIVLALEAGSLDSFCWPQQIFANRVAFEDFVDELSVYDDCYRLTDQWWRALAMLCEIGDEEGFVTSAEIAKEFRSCVYEDGKIENFGREVPVYKYSVEQFLEARLKTIKYGGSDQSLSPKGRAQLEEIDRFGHYYSERPTEAQMQAALEEGKLLKQADFEAKNAATK